MFPATWLCKILISVKFEPQSSGMGLATPSLYEGEGLGGAYARLWQQEGANTWVTVSSI